MHSELLTNMKNKLRLIELAYKNSEIYTLHDIYQNGIAKDNGEYIIDVFQLSSEVEVQYWTREYIKYFEGNYSIEELTLIINGVKHELEKNFSNPNVLHLIMFLARFFFHLCDRTVKLKYENLLVWNELSSVLNYEILISSFIALHPEPSEIVHEIGIPFHDNNKLNSIIEKGVSENHMHLNGSGYSFELNWYNFIYEIPIYSKLLKNFASFIVKNLNSYEINANERQELVLVKLKIIRMLLDVYLDDKNLLLDIVLWTKSALNCKKITEIIDMTYQKEFVNLTTIHSRIYSNYDKESFYSQERVFLIKVFYEINRNSIDAFLLYLFNLYLIGFNQFTFHFIQDNNGMGFSKFLYKEKVKGHFIRKDEWDKIHESVLFKYYSEYCIKSIEMRIAPRNPRELENLIKKMTTYNDNLHNKKFHLSDKINFGFIIHYIKNDEIGLVEYPRNCTVRAKIESESVHAFEWFSEDRPLIKSVVGIDAANTEANCRAEVFGEVFRSHRTKISKRHKFCTTYHVGEDFPTLCDGLRAIDEAIDFLCLNKGDRIGHATALGFDLSKYFSIKMNKIITTQQSYLDDIAWMIRIIRDKNIESYSYKQFLEKEFSKNSSFILEMSVDVCDYIDSMSLRGDDPKVYAEPSSPYKINYEHLCYQDKINYKDIKHKGCYHNEKARYLIFKYHYCRDSRKKGDLPYIEEAPPIYIEILSVCQSYLIEKILRLGLIIEVNPSSNCKISAISRINDLPFLNLNKHFLESNKVDLPIVINTDDSAIFQTNLRNEYSLVCAILQSIHSNFDSVYQHLDYLRQLSNDTTFLSS
ncbi:MAG: hypothetical protein Q8S15_06880 [Erysipelotrichaceae bacterium]|nr:hypothetical protein [Erysipelotrichaceae bacterium]